MKNKIIVAIALMAMLPASQALSQSANPPTQSGASGSEPDSKGSSGWSGGAGSHIGNDQSSTPPTSYQPPVATGLDLRGPTKTKPPFAE
jgi:hypothetical protein